MLKDTLQKAAATLYDGTHIRIVSSSTRSCILNGAVRSEISDAALVHAREEHNKVFTVGISVRNFIIAPNGSDGSNDIAFTSFADVHALSNAAIRFQKRLCYPRKEELNAFPDASVV